MDQAPRSNLALELERCRQHIEAALRTSPDNLSFNDVHAAILRGDAHLWPGERSVVVAEFPKTFHFWLAGGDLRELVTRHHEAEAWARLNQCDRMTMVGRKGWERVMAPLGYRPVTVLTKEL